MYIGDGATVTQSFIRRRGKTLIGHSPVRTQLTWCEKERVPLAIVTHCGSQIVTGDERQLFANLRGIAAERGVEIFIAYDGMKLMCERMFLEKRRAGRVRTPEVSRNTNMRSNLFSHAVLSERGESSHRFGIWAGHTHSIWSLGI